MNAQQAYLVQRRSYRSSDQIGWPFLMFLVSTIRFQGIIPLQILQTTQCVQIVQWLTHVSLESQTSQTTSAPSWTRHSPPGPPMVVGTPITWQVGWKNHRIWVGKTIGFGCCISGKVIEVRLEKYHPLMKHEFSLIQLLTASLDPILSGSITKEKNILCLGRPHDLLKPRNLNFQLV